MKVSFSMQRQSDVAGYCIKNSVIRAAYILFLRKLSEEEESWARASDGREGSAYRFVGNVLGRLNCDERRTLSSAGPKAVSNGELGIKSTDCISSIIK
jgi:hypothetical protein